VKTLSISKSRAKPQGLIGMRLHVDEIFTWFLMGLMQQALIVFKVKSGGVDEWQELPV
jgi:hypothetical protein